MRFSIFFVFALSLSGCVSYSPEDLKPNSAVLLDFVPHYLVEPCSRTAAPEFESVWQPSPEQISEMEKNFLKLIRLKSTGCCIEGGKLRSLREYDLLYVGVISKGKHLILIATAGDWCDGGFGSWGAVYDVETSSFRDLHVNGIA